MKASPSPRRCVAALLGSKVVFTAFTIIDVFILSWNFIRTGAQRRVTL